MGQPAQISRPNVVFLALAAMLMWFQADSSMWLKCTISFLAALCTKSSLSCKGAQRQGDLLGNDFAQVTAHLCSDVSVSRWKRYPVHGLKQVPVDKPTTQNCKAQQRPICRDLWQESLRMYRLSLLLSEEHRITKYTHF